MSARSVLLSKWAALGGQSIVIAGLIARLLSEECPACPPPGLGVDSVLTPMQTYLDSDSGFSAKELPTGVNTWMAIRRFNKDGVLGDPSKKEYVYNAGYRLFFASEEDSLIWWWPFHEGRGTKTKDIVSFKSATISGAIWAEGASLSEFALSFDGVDDKVVLGNLDYIGTEFSLGAIINVTRGADIMARIIDKSTDAGSLWQLSLYQTGSVKPDSFQLRMKLRTTSSATPAIIFTPSYCIKAGTWYKVVGFYNGESICLYVDDVLVATKACTGDVVSDPTIPVYVGSGYKGSPFKGKIDDIRITKSSQTLRFN
jgi:hypothetical protein